MGCADCGCVIDAGFRVSRCPDSACCCADLPVAPELTRIANRIRAALELPDPAMFRDLLDPNVRWGVPGDPAPSCQNRDQVLAWYERGRERGVRATVTELLVRSDKVVVGLRVTRDGAEDDATDRWQVLSVHGDRVADIRAYDDRDEAYRAAGAVD